MGKNANRIRSIQNGINRALGIMVSGLSASSKPRTNNRESKPRMTSTLNLADRPILVVKRKINLGDEVMKHGTDMAVAKVRAELRSAAGTENRQTSTFRSYAKKVQTRMYNEKYTSRDLGICDYKRQRINPKGGQRITSCDLRIELMG